MAPRWLRRRGLVDSTLSFGVTKILRRYWFWCRHRRATGGVGSEGDDEGSDLVALDF